MVHEVVTGERTLVINGYEAAKLLNLYMKDFINTKIGHGQD